MNVNANLVVLAARFGEAPMVAANRLKKHLFVGWGDLKSNHEPVAFTVGIGKRPCGWGHLSYPLKSNKHERSGCCYSGNGVKEVRDIHGYLSSVGWAFLRGGK